MSDQKTATDSRAGKRTAQRIGTPKAGLNNSHHKRKNRVRGNELRAKNEHSFNGCTVPDVTLGLKRVGDENSLFQLRTFFETMQIPYSGKEMKVKLFRALSLFLNIKSFEISEKETLVELIRKCHRLFDAGYHYLPDFEEIAYLEVMFTCEEMGTAVVDWYDIEVVREQSLKEGMALGMLSKFILDEYRDLFENYYNHVCFMKEVAEEEYCSHRAEKEHAKGFLEDHAEYGFLERLIDSAANATVPFHKKRKKLLQKLADKGFFNLMGITADVVLILKNGVNKSLTAVNTFNVENYRVNIHRDVEDYHGDIVCFNDLFILLRNQPDDYSNPYMSELDERWGNSGSAAYIKGTGDRFTADGDNSILLLHGAISNVGAAIYQRRKSITK